MNTLEDRLRAALTAKSDAVAFSMLSRSVPALDADPGLDAAPVLPLPEPRPHRSRRMVAAALAVAAVLLVAFGAVALHRATDANRFGPAHVRPRSAIPWNQVGPGWALIEDAPRTKVDPDIPGNRVPDQLVRVLLIDPRGVQYLITTLDAEQWSIGDWSARTERLLISPNRMDVEHNLDSVLVLDLRTGNRRSITVPGNYGGWRFTGPDDQSILFESQPTLTTYSLTGQLEARFPGAANVPVDTVDSPDGTQIITGGKDGLVVRDRRTGQQVQTLAAPAGFSYCGDPFWEPHGELVARCTPKTSHYGEGAQWFMFSRGSSLTPGRTDRRLGPDNSTTGLRQGYVRRAGNGYGVFSPAHTTVTLFDESGNASQVEVPTAFAETGWSAMPEDSGVDTVSIAHSSSDSRRDVLDSWNPFTGKVTELYRASPTGTLLSYVPWHEPNG